MKKNLLYLFTALSVVLLSSCLTYEKKQYTYTIHDNGSVTLTIKYFNIVSDTSYDFRAVQADENESSSARLKRVVESDFRELMDDYLRGEESEDRLKAGNLRSKRLFEEKGTLCGEVVFQFANIEDAGFEKDEKGRLVVSTDLSSRDKAPEVQESNGVSDPMDNEIAWNAKEESFWYTVEPSNGAPRPENSFSLLELWKNAK